MNRNSLASQQRYSATRTWFTWTLESGSTCPPYGCFEIVEFTVGDDGRVIIVGKAFADATKPFAVNGPTEVAVDEHGRCLLDDPVVVAVDGTPLIGDAIGPVSGSYEVSTSGTGLVALGSPVDGKLVATRTDGTGGAVLIRGTATEAWDATEPIAVTYTEAYGRTLSAPTINWYNTHNHVFDSGADVIAVAKQVGSDPTWQAIIISAQESHYECDANAIIDGGNSLSESAYDETPDDPAGPS